MCLETASSLLRCSFQPQRLYKYRLCYRNLAAWPTFHSFPLPYDFFFPCFALEPEQYSYAVKLFLDSLYIYIKKKKNAPFVPSGIRISITHHSFRCWIRFAGEILFIMLYKMRQHFVKKKENTQPLTPQLSNRLYTSRHFNLASPEGSEVRASPAAQRE